MRSYFQNRPRQDVTALAVAAMTAKPDPASAGAQYGQIEKLIHQFKLSSEPERLAFIFHELGITHFFEYAMNEAKERANFYLDSCAIPGSWIDCAINAYEGCIWESVDKTDTSLALCATLFHRMLNPHNELKLATAGAPTHIASEVRAVRRASIVTQMLREGKKPNILDPVIRIACDAAMMQVYMNDNMLIQYFSGVWTSIQETRYLEGRKYMTQEFFLQEQVRIHQGYMWRSAWGKKKAFTLNHPLRVQHMKNLMARVLPNLAKDHGHTN